MVITETKQWKKIEKKITLIDDDGAKMHGSLTNIMHKFDQINGICIN